MSATAIHSPSGDAALASAHANLRPTFLGVLRGEIFKVSRQRATWFMVLVLAGILTLPYLVNFSAPHYQERLEAHPLIELYNHTTNNLLVLRIFSGTFLILLTARLIGMEYSSGTIRILLGRGVGRLQLLSAKLLTAALAALSILVFGLLLNVVLTLITLKAVTGNLDALNALNDGFWSDMRLYIATILISMGVTILMAAAVTVVGRSLAIGLSVGISWFAADNLGLVFFFLAFRLTNSNFWLLATGDFLGPNLNAMPTALLPLRANLQGERALIVPFVPVDGGHTLLVTAIYAAVFLVTAVILTWRRDVLE